MSLTVTILGCGSSGGVPRPALGWGACNPANPKNRRRRCSILVERKGPNGTTSVLVDTSPDLREQLLDANVTKLDGVLFTHEHADHTHGIDDLRGLFIKHRRRIDAYFDEPTSRAMHARFGYCFMTPPGSEYPPILAEHRILPGRPVTIDGDGGPVTALPVLQDHGDIPSLGFRFEGIGYSADLVGLPDESLAAFEDLDLWIVDALRHTPHPSHFSLSDALHWIERLAPQRAVLTNMHTDLDYDALSEALPSHVVPAYDGMRITI
jgi:phosphoribosyl 1,2-cyclic phosphate phosphodiesterase